MAQAAHTVGGVPRRGELKISHTPAQPTEYPFGLLKSHSVMIAVLYKFLFVQGISRMSQHTTSRTIMYAHSLSTIIGGEATGDREATEMNPCILGTPQHSP